MQPKVVYLFEAFYHPFVCDFIEHLNHDGIHGLLKWELLKDGTETSVQKDMLVFFDTANQYKPAKNAVLRPYPNDEVDFLPEGAYSQYNWELFFYAPFLIATRL